LIDQRYKAETLFSSQLGKEEFDKAASDLKMGLEEEKLLRGQDMEILKFNLSEGMKDLKEDLTKTKGTRANVKQRKYFYFNSKKIPFTKLKLSDSIITIKISQV